MLVMRLRRALPLFAALPMALSTAAAEPLAPENFETLHTLIKPDGSEDQWTQIPWRTSLWDARIEAGREGKPILLWEMDGHPLGCT